MKKKLTKPQLTKKLQKIFNHYIRLRDKNLRCISCTTGAVENAGHYWSTSQCPQPSMRFNEKNVNGQCVSCNKWKAGNIQPYRRGLIKKYGESVIQELDVCKSLPQNPWQRFEYEIMIEHYKNLVKKLS